MFEWQNFVDGRGGGRGGFNASGAGVVMGILNTLKRPWNLIYACEFLCLLLYVCFIINDLLIVFFIVEIEVILLQCDKELGTWIKSLYDLPYENDNSNMQESSSRNCNFRPCSKISIVLVKIWQHLEHITRFLVICKHF